MEGRMGVSRRGKAGRNNENENERTKERKKPKGSEEWIRQEGRTKKKKGTKKNEIQGGREGDTNAYATSLCGAI